MRMKQLLANYRQNKLLYWLILPSLIFILIFNYIPMGGLIIAFQDYSFTRGIWGSEWIGSVSYTHLSIQRKISTTALSKRICIYPVSYTHLDVYKRQP